MHRTCYRVSNLVSIFAVVINKVVAKTATSFGLGRFGIITGKIVFFLVVEVGKIVSILVFLLLLDLVWLSCIDV